MSLAFKGRHFAPDIILLCMRWYCRYPLSYRDLEEMMAERGLSVDHFEPVAAQPPIGDFDGQKPGL